MIMLNGQQSLVLWPPTWIAFKPLSIQSAHDVTNRPQDIELAYSQGCLKTSCLAARTSSTRLTGVV